MWFVVLWSASVSSLLLAANPDDVFVARPVTSERSFTAGIEGPACDKLGDIFAVNFQREGTIGRVTPDGKAEVFVELPPGSVGNGIRFDRQGMMYVADYTRHNVLGKMPSNICFGGPDGCTAYVTEMERRRLVEFRVDRPGLSWKRWRE